MAVIFRPSPSIAEEQTNIAVQAARAIDIISGAGIDNVGHVTCATHAEETLSNRLA